jgi:hypothetical protein
MPFYLHLSTNPGTKPFSSSHPVHSFFDPSSAIIPTRIPFIYSSILLPPQITKRSSEHTSVCALTYPTKIYFIYRIHGLISTTASRHLTERTAWTASIERCQSGGDADL